MSKASSSEPCVTRERKKMFGRPVHLLTAAALAAAASLLTISSASANCFSGCGGYGYAAPVTYSAPVVYSQSYASPCSPCGYGGYGGFCFFCGGFVGGCYLRVVGDDKETPTPNRRAGRPG